MNRTVRDNMKSNVLMFILVSEVAKKAYSFFLSVSMIESKSVAIC